MNASTSDMHALDIATELTENGDGSYQGRTTPAYANMVGPFGGTTASIMMQAALIHPERLGDPIALTVNYAGAVADGEFTVTPRAVRTNRSTQHWYIEISQGGAITTTATAVFATRADTWSSTEIDFPEAPPAANVQRSTMTDRAPWTQNYDMRFVRGGFPADLSDEGEPDSITTLWIRDDPPRPLDFVSLTSISDAFFPRIFTRRRVPVPAGTVSITTYFHTDADRLAQIGTAPLLGTARALRFNNRYFDQTAEVWSDQQELLASSHQIVYFKE